jgi:hypothetical protein
VLGEIVTSARHVTERYANNSIEADHARLKARLRPMRGLKRVRPARTIAAGHAFVQNLHRGHYAITVDLPVHDRVRVAFAELTLSPLLQAEASSSPATPSITVLAFPLNCMFPPESSRVTADRACSSTLARA